MNLHVILLIFSVLFQFYFKIFIGVQLIYNVVLVSGVWVYFFVSVSNLETAIYPVLYSRTSLFMHQCIFFKLFFSFYSSRKELLSKWYR